MENLKITSVILTGISAVGVVATAVLASKATLKANRLYEARLQYDENAKPTDKETIKETWKHYIPTAIAGAATIGCIIGINGVNKKQLAAMTGAYVLLDSTYKKHKDKIKEVLGNETFEKIRRGFIEDEMKKNDISEYRTDENLLFYEEHIGKFFEKTMLEVQDAEYQLNRKLAIDGEVTLNDFFEFLGLDPIEIGDALGWSVETICDSNHPAWIDFEHELIETDDGLECRIITFVDQPISNFA